MKRKPLSQFKKDVVKEIGWNSAIAFWCEYTYELYKRGLKDYDAALEILKPMKNYTGV